MNMSHDDSRKAGAIAMPASRCHAMRSAASHALACSLRCAVMRALLYDTCAFDTLSSERLSPDTS